MRPQTHSFLFVGAQRGLRLTIVHETIRTLLGISSDCGGKVGTWKAINAAPSFYASTMLLLTDGTVLCHDAGSTESGTPNWWRLTPSPQGDYVAGTWSQVAPAPNAGHYFASAVLADGRVFVAGGEYNGVANPPAELCAAEIYDPVADTWHQLPTPDGWTAIGDAPCCMLPDGRVLIGSIESRETALFDPVTEHWTPGPMKYGNAETSSTEESWVLLGDGSVLSVDCKGHPDTERLLPTRNGWVSAGPTSVDLVDALSLEVGPAVLLTDGRVFALGATGETSIFLPPVGGGVGGVWEPGPPIPERPPDPRTIGAKDAPACLLPNGKVLCTGGPLDGVTDYLGPTYFYEYDPVANAFSFLAAPPNMDAALGPYTGRFLVVPTGQVLFSDSTQMIWIYTPDGQPAPDWHPTTTDCPNRLVLGATYTLKGTQFNGLSQGAFYGDDATMATNYPIVRLDDAANHRSVYCRTHDHSTMGVATGATTVTTSFDVPADCPPGTISSS